MLIRCKKSKIILVGLLIILLSIFANASELNNSTIPFKKNLISVNENDLVKIKAVLSEQSEAIRLLSDMQSSNELEVKLELLEASLEDIVKKEVQFNEDNRLERRLELIESSLYSISNKDEYFTYADWAAVAITCVAVLLTIVGLAIGALAFWGFKEIKDITKNSAAKEAASIAKQTMEENINQVAKSELEKLINDGKLREPLQDAVDMILRNDTNSIDVKRTEQLFQELDKFDDTENEEVQSSGTQ